MVLLSPLVLGSGPFSARSESAGSQAQSGWRHDAWLWLAVGEFNLGPVGDPFGHPPLVPELNFS